MTDLLPEVLAVWLVATAACSALLGAVVAWQAAVARARRTRPWRRRTGARSVPSGLGQAAGPRR